MRYKALFPTVSLGLLAACGEPPSGPTDRALLAAGQAALATPAVQTAFAGFIHFCTSAPPEDVIVTPGGTLHPRDATNRNQWVTGNPLIDGFEANVVDGNINLKSGTGFAHLVVTLRPVAVNGTWEIQQTLDIAGGVPAGGNGVGHGTGELLGYTLMYTTTPFGLGQNTCNASRPSASVQGVVLAPADPG